MEDIDYTESLSFLLAIIASTGWRGDFSPLS